MLVLLSAQGCLSARSKTGWNSDARAVAAAVELVHAASLVHDDVMDGAVERRHQPTIVHAKGISAAVLLGDYLFTRAYAMAASCRSTLPARQIAAAATRLCEGELRQQASTGNWQISWSEYRSILTQKTAALCAVSCRLGGWLSGASPREQLALNRFGRELGLAFQIYDDWLDYWGTDRVGKTLGTDLAQLKPTLPLIRLLSQSKSAERRRVIELLEQGSPAALEGVRAALERSDAGDFTLRVAQRCAQGALSSLAPLRASVAKECLMAIADYSVTRVV
jgi:octaprenyl-diphosphate synthase